MTINWRDVPEYENLYEVSDSGLIRNFKTKKLRKLFSNQNSCMHVDLWKDNKRKTFKVHRLVLEAFGVSPLSHQTDCCHNDGNYKNNHINNLRWGTRKENHADKLLHGTQPLGEKVYNAKLSLVDIEEIRAARIAGESCVNLSKRFNVHQSLISRVSRGKRWSHAVGSIYNN